jgi:hypothetical protein
VPLAATRAYLEEECLFDPGARLGPALGAFRAAAARLGLAPTGSEPRRVSVPGLAGEPHHPAE